VELRFLLLVIAAMQHAFPTLADELAPTSAPTSAPGSVDEALSSQSDSPFWTLLLTVREGQGTLSPSDIDQITETLDSANLSTRERATQLIAEIPHDRFTPALLAKITRIATDSKDSFSYPLLLSLNQLSLNQRLPGPVVPEIQRLMVQVVGSTQRMSANLARDWVLERAFEGTFTDSIAQTEVAQMLAAGDENVRVRAVQIFSALSKIEPEAERTFAVHFSQLTDAQAQSLQVRLRDSAAQLRMVQLQSGKDLRLANRAHAVLLRSDLQHPEVFIALEHIYLYRDGPITPANLKAHYLLKDAIPRLKGYPELKFRLLRSLSDPGSMQAIVQEFGSKKNISPEVVADALSDPKPEIRSVARKIIAAIGTENADVLHSVAKGLTDSEVEIRTQTLQTLGELRVKEPDIQEAIARATSSWYPTIRQHATEALLNLTPTHPDVEEALLGLLGSGKPDIRRRAAEALTRSQLTPESTREQALAHSLRDSDERVADAVFKHFRLNPPTDPVAIRTLANTLSAPRFTTALQAADILGRVEWAEPKIHRALANALASSPELSIRSLCAIALIRHKSQDPAAQDTLAQLLADKSDAMRELAAQVLASLGPLHPRVREKFNLALNSVDPAVLKGYHSTGGSSQDTTGCLKKSLLREGS
jgi:HEAT repeat protein